MRALILAGEKELGYGQLSLMFQNQWRQYVVSHF